jgi:hypothetical protein
METPQSKFRLTASEVAQIEELRGALDRDSKTDVVRLAVSRLWTDTFASSKKNGKKSEK